MRFWKMHGAGNDFLLFTSADTESDWPGRAKAWCSRRTSVGGDGLVVAKLLGLAPPMLEVACYNADGSLATMCGNALRCVAWWAAEEYGVREMTLTMAGTRHEARVDADRVAVTAAAGAPEMRRVNTVWNGRPLRFDAVHTGTEHVVAVVEDVEAVDAEACGRLIRHHRDLAPLGTNVNFVQSAGTQALKIRTYERGVEAETLSCGSGAVAAAVIATVRGLISEGEITVHNRAGVPLTVSPQANSPAGRTYWVAGPVTYVCEGALA